MNKLSRLFSLLVLSTIGIATVISAQELTIREIMAEPSIAGMRVEGEKLSPDGTKVVFLWNAEGRYPQDLYLVPTSGGEKPKVILRLTDLPPAPPRNEKENKLDYGLELRDDFVKQRERSFGNLEWSPDSSKLLFTVSGDMYVLTIGENSAKRYTNTKAAEVAAKFIDNDRILYQQTGDIFVLNIADATTVQLTKDADAAKFISVGAATVSKDGKMLAYVVSDSSKFRSLVVPNYLGEFTAAGNTRRGWSEQKLFVTLADGSRDTPLEIKLPKQEGVGGFRSIKWAADDRSLIVDRGDKDTKRRQLFYIRNAASKDEQIITVADETDDKWQSPLSGIVEPNPHNADQLFFCSEKDGFNHIYLADISNGTASVKQLTKGNWQVEWAKWINGTDEIVFLSTKGGASERTFSSILTDRSNDPKPIGLINKGMLSSPQMDEINGQPTLIFDSSTWNKPDDIFSIKVCLRCRGLFAVEQLTNTIPSAFTNRNWVAPKFISIPSRDGKQIPAKIYLPEKRDAKQKLPMVIFVHGAGYLQNVINGWNNYYREFMFNEMLVQKGYVVLDIDYRGSAGYGRDWRTDVYDFLGGKDFDDHIDAIDFMIKDHGVDPKRVGVYGGSYGGFMAEMLAFRAPEKIAAAAALRPVADWKNYYASSPGYTAQRLGFPDKNPEAYKRSSPITYADGLKTKLLILHGMADDNVHVQDSVQLTEKLIRLGKTEYFETMFYPSENHGFVRPESWTDEYERILLFFERNLK